MESLTLTLVGEIGTTRAAATLQVSAPTVRAWARAGAISGRIVTRGGRQVWRLDEDSVAAFAEQRARQAQAHVTLASLAARVNALEASETGPSTPVDGAVRVVDALTLRAVVAEQAAADEARAKVIEHLLAALAANEIADKHRRAAITAAQTALGYKLIPDDPSTIEDASQR